MSKLLLLIFLLISNISFSQYYLDSTQASKTIRIKFERDSLLITNQYIQTENDSLNSQVKILNRKLELKQNIIDMQDTVLTYKDKQIAKLEQTPTIIQENKTKWYVYAGIIITSACAGTMAGILLK